MIQFNVNARDGSVMSGVGICNTGCCCFQANAVPGEINKWRLNFSLWVLPIGGRGLISPVSITFEKLNAEVVASGNLPPVVADVYFSTPHNTNLVSTLTATDPEAAALTFAVVGTGPQYGKLTAFSPATGAFTYAPPADFNAIDTFAFTVSDGVNTVTRQVKIAVQGASGNNLPLTETNPFPVLRVDPNKVKIVSPLIEFPLEVAPDAKPGDIYRMTLVASAMDCEGTVFRHSSCYDIVITKC